MKAIVTILETNFEVEYEIEITASGSPETGPSYSSGGEPAEPAEFEIEVLEIRTPGQHDDVVLDLPEWFKELIETHLYERDDVNEVAQQIDQDRDYCY